MQTYEQCSLFCIFFFNINYSNFCSISEQSESKNGSLLYKWYQSKNILFFHKRDTYQFFHMFFYIVWQKSYKTWNCNSAFCPHRLLNLNQKKKDATGHKLYISLYSCMNQQMTLQIVVECINQSRWDYIPLYIVPFIFSTYCLYKSIWFPFHHVGFGNSLAKPSIFYRPCPQYDKRDLILVHSGFIKYEFYWLTG